MSSIEQYEFAIASALVAVSAGAFGWTLVSVLTERRLGTESHAFEQERRKTLREKYSIYRWLEPLVDEFASFVRQTSSKRLVGFERELGLAGECEAWRGEEFIAKSMVEGVLLGGLAFGLFAIASPVNAAIGSILLAIGYVFLAKRSVVGKAAMRLNSVRSRLPYTVDLIALMMEAGGGFQECLQTAVDENSGHPVADELADVLRQITLGRSRREALLSFETRLNDDDVSELVFAVNKGEELGTPLTAILREQAEQMRLKRSQWGEKAAAEAAVSIVFPGMVVMIACLLVVIAPIVLPAVLAVL